MMKKLLKFKILFVFALLFCAVSINSLKAATETEINDAIRDGLAWLATQQNANGQFGYGANPVAYTAAAVLAFENEGHFPGGTNTYSTHVEKGLDFIFNYAKKYNLPAGSPYDSDNNLLAICFWDDHRNREVYETGMVMQAIAASNTPGRTVPAGAPYIGGWTYYDVMVNLVDWAAFGQVDAGTGRGGWRYYANYVNSDNSTAQWPVLGLIAAEQWGILAPAFVKSELNYWITYIQNPNGGSGYSSPNTYVNCSKTGGLLVEMDYVGDDKSSTRAQQAQSFLNNRWGFPPNGTWYGNKGHSYAMFSVFKGLELMEITTIPNAPANSETPAGDWWGDYSEWIVNAQYSNGSWPGYTYWNSWLSTAWYIVILQATVLPIEVAVELPSNDCGCDTGFDIVIDYSVERFPASGSLNLFKDDVLIPEASVILTDFQGNATHTYHVSSDDPGTSVWKAVLNVTGGGITTSAEDQAELTVCESPVVAGIPDQITPFVPFDLDDFVTNGLLTTWTSSTHPGWTIIIDPNNVATVISPPGVNPPVDITFTASTSCCGTTVCTGFDVAKFTPNRPPVAVCKAAQVELGEDGTGTLTPADVNDGSFDPDPGDAITLAIDKADFDCADLGPNTVTLTVADLHGATDFCEAVVTVVDLVDPEITLAGDNPMEVVRFTSYTEPGAGVTDNCDPDPDLTISGSVDVNLPGTYTITYDAVDDEGNTSQVERTVNVINDPDALACGFLYHAKKDIKVDKMVQGVGNMHSNDKIDLKKGPATYVGNLWAVKKIHIKKNVTVDGDATSGKDVKIDKNATVTGIITENAIVAEIPIPVLSYIAGTDDVKLKKNETLTLPPGSYKKVEAGKEAVLTLTTGEYFFKDLKLKEKSELIVDLSTGPVVINVTKKMDFDKEVTMTLLPLGEVDSRYVTINSMKDIKIDKECTIIGSLVAHKKVEFKKDVYFRGSACGDHIHVDQNGTALYHDTGSGVLPKSGADTFVENDSWEYDIQKETLPESFMLNQNYPNPFNPTTMISFQLPEAAYVKLTVYDVLGNEIALLAEGNRGAGSYTVEFDAGNLSTGVYIYRLVANEFTQIKKMILSK